MAGLNLKHSPTSTDKFWQRPFRAVCTCGSCCLIYKTSVA